MNLVQMHAFGEAMRAGDADAASKVLRGLQVINDRLGLGVVRWDEDSIVLTMELSKEFEGNTEGGVHGGILATFADIASGMALHSLFNATSIPVTTDMHVRYYRQPRVGPLTADAKVVHRGRQLLSTECRVEDAQNRELARITATYMLVPFNG